MKKIAFVSLILAPSMAMAQAAPTAPKPAAPVAAPTAPKPAVAPAAPKPAAPVAAAPKPAAPAAAAPKPAAPAAAAPKPAAPVAPAKVDFYASGEKKFKANDFAGALADFNEVKLGEMPKAAADARAPMLARYQAQCEDKLGKLREAAGHYEFFANNAPKTMTKEVDAAKKRVEEIRTMPGKIQFTANAEGTEVFLDDKSVGKAPIEVDVPAGKHRVRAVAPGRDPWTGDMEIPYAARATVAIDMPVPPPPPAAVAVLPPPAPVQAQPAPVQPVAATTAAEPKSKLPAYITGGVALAALGVGTAFGIKALGHQSDFDKNPTEDSANSGENAALIADMAFGVALTFGITSAVLFFSGDEDEPVKAAGKKPIQARRKIIPVPIINATGGGAGAVFRF
jgi:hypothetical protein